MAKAKVAEFKKSQKATGGGPPAPDLPELVKKIFELIPTQFERIDNEFDDDATLVDDTGDEKIEKIEGPEKESQHQNSKVNAKVTEQIVEPMFKKARVDDSSLSKNKTPDHLLKMKESFMVEEHERKMLLLNKEESQMTMLFEKRMQALDAEIRASQAKSSYYKHLSQKMRNELQQQSTWMTQGANPSNFYVSQSANENFTSL